VGVRVFAVVFRSAMSFIAKNERCVACGKTVYAMELIKADGLSYHKTCMKCAQCNCTLKLGNYAALGGKFYCKPHFKQLFALKGNYHGGFAEGAAAGYVSEGHASPAPSHSPAPTHSAPSHTPAPTPVTAPAPEKPVSSPVPPKLTPQPVSTPAPTWTAPTLPSASAGPSDSEKKQLDELKKKVEEDRRKLEADRKAFLAETEKSEKELEAKRKETAEAKAAAASTPAPKKEAPAPVSEGLSPAEELLCEAFAHLLRDPQKKSLAMAKAKVA